MEEIRPEDAGVSAEELQQTEALAEVTAEPSEDIREQSPQTKDEAQEEGLQEV